MPYEPRPVPGEGNIRALQEFVRDELRTIAEVVNRGQFQSVRLDQLGHIDHLPRPRNGDLAYFLDGAGTPQDVGGLHLFGGGIWAAILPIQRGQIDIIRPDPVVEGIVTGSGAAWTPVTFTTVAVGDVAGFTHDGAGAITVAFPPGLVSEGTVLSFILTITVGTNVNQQFNLAATVAVNGVALGELKGAIDVRSNSDRWQLTAHGQGDLADGDVITVVVQNLTGGTDVVVRELHLQVSYITSLEQG